MTKTINFSNDGIIDPMRVKAAVYSRIKFDLPDMVWEEIDTAFAECWNNKIGLRGWVHEGQIERYIDNYLMEQKIILEYSKIEQIVKVISDYIQMTGGYLKE